LMRNYKLSYEEEYSGIVDESLLKEVPRSLSEERGKIAVELSNERLKLERELEAIKES
jgi:hypothetical protein